MKLYQNPISHNCRRAAIVAAELGLPVETVLIHVTEGEHKTPEFLARNPNGMIPTLVDGDFTLWEARAIMQYLAEKKPEAKLLGENARERADVTRWLLWDGCHLNRWVGAVMFEKLVKPLLKMGEPDEAAVEAAREQIKRYLGVLETCLAGTTHLVGGRLTIADLSLACCFTYWDLMGVPLEDCPNVRAWLSRVTALESWKTTQPQLPAAAE